MKKLFGFIMSVVVGVALCGTVSAQSVVSDVFTLNGLTQNKTAKKKDGVFVPPALSVSVEFITSDGTGVLKAFDNAAIRLTISNDGADASNVKAMVQPAEQYRGIEMDSGQVVTSVPGGRKTIVDFPIRAKADIETAKDRIFNIKVSEPLGYDIEAVLSFPTLEYIKPKLIMNGVTEISEYGEGLVARGGVPDGKVQAGDLVSVSVMVQNAGAGLARDVRYHIVSQDENVILYVDSGPASSLAGRLGDMEGGAVRNLSFRLGVNNRYTDNGGYLPVYIELDEPTGAGNLSSTNIPVPFDAVPVEPEVVTVDADLDRMLASIGKVNVVSLNGNINSGQKKVRDITSIPEGKSLFPNAVAIVLGVETYSDPTIPDAPYARKDAKIMGGYFSKTMGVGDVRVLTDGDVTRMNLTTLFDPEKGRLANIVDPDSTDVFVYYSGHGVPVEEKDGGNDVLLVPYDVEKSWIKDYGFSLNKLYRDLAALEAKSVTVILDACFSGGSRSSQRFRSQNVAGQKLVIVDEAQLAQPWLADAGFRIFTSSRGDQTSLGNDLSQSGLFTYYIAVGLQGDADKNEDGQVTIGELSEFVTSSVDKESQGSQTPQFYGDGGLVMLKIK